MEVASTRQPGFFGKVYLPFTPGRAAILNARLTPLR
jgi:hypothetical protein